MSIYKTHQCPNFYPCILTLSDYLNILSSYSHHITLEMQTVSLAGKNISPEHIQKMENLLMKEEESSGNDDLLNQTNISFHLEIAAASGNLVLYQMLSVLLSVYRDEQQFLSKLYRSSEREHSQHLKIFDALRSKNKKLALERMKHHLTWVRKSIENRCPDENRQINE